MSCERFINLFGHGRNENDGNYANAVLVKTQRRGVRNCYILTREVSAQPRQFLPKLASFDYLEIGTYSINGLRLGNDPMECVGSNGWSGVQGLIFRINMANSSSSRAFNCDLAMAPACIFPTSGLAISITEGSVRAATGVNTNITISLLCSLFQASSVAECAPSALISGRFRLAAVTSLIHADARN